MQDVVYARSLVASKRLLLPAARSTRVVEYWPMSEPSDLLLRELPLIEQIVRSICRRNGMDLDATEEFAAEVRLRLVKDDYAIIRAFGGRSRFSTYMGAVIKRLLIDYRRHDWGKWHDSAEAVRMGERAVAVERALFRDGRSIDDALVHLQAKFPGMTRLEIDAITVRVPRRVRRVMVDIDQAAAVEAPSASDESVRSETGYRISRIVCSYIDALSVEDQLVFRLRFDSDMSVAQIARSLHLDQPSLYRRLYKHFSDLREMLVRAGLDARAVEGVIGSDSAPLNFRLKNRDVRPSEDDESAVAAPEEEPSS